MECSNGVGFGVGEEAQEGDGRTAQMDAQLHLIITDFFFSGQQTLVQHCKERKPVLG